MKLTQRSRISGKARRLYHLERQRRLWAHHEIEETLLPGPADRPSFSMAPVRRDSPLLAQVSAVDRGERESDARGVSLRPAVRAPGEASEAEYAYPQAVSANAAVSTAVIRPPRAERRWSLADRPGGVGESSGGRGPRRLHVSGRGVALGVLLGTIAALAALLLIRMLAG